MPGNFAADDWGMSPSINDAILDLARLKLLTSVSVLANLPYAAHRLEKLREIPGLSVGLHLNLTLGKPVARGVERELCSGSGEFPRLTGLMLRLGMRPRRATRAVAAELEAQWERLQRLGVRPAFLDGHQHIHLLPGVLPAVLEFMSRKSLREIRTVSAKSHPAHWLGVFQRRALAGFACVPHAPFGAKAGETGVRTIIHPAAYDDFAGLEFRDDLTLGRIREYLRVKDISGCGGAT